MEGFLALGISSTLLVVSIDNSQHFLSLICNEINTLKKKKGDDRRRKLFSLSNESWWWEAGRLGSKMDLGDFGNNLSSPYSTLWNCSVTPQPECLHLQNVSSRFKPQSTTQLCKKITFKIFKKQSISIIRPHSVVMTVSSSQPN